MRKQKPPESAVILLADASSQHEAMVVVGGDALVALPAMVRAKGSGIGAEVAVVDRINTTFCDISLTII